MFFEGNSLNFLFLKNLESSEQQTQRAEEGQGGGQGEGDVGGGGEMVRVNPSKIVAALKKKCRFSNTAGEKQKAK